jgi:hypothetical protein
LTDLSLGFKLFNYANFANETFKAQKLNKQIFKIKINLLY